MKNGDNTPETKWRATKATPAMIDQKMTLFKITPYSALLKSYNIYHTILLSTQQVNQGIGIKHQEPLTLAQRQVLEVYL